ncbi:MAG: hypothetical protein JJD92_09800 [Frankiaceae bacterium]|nr:hypothetical protein [Frankiaceae bacterium]
MTLPDPRRLADVLNPINVCEYDGGLAEVRLGVTCSENAPQKELRIPAVQGQLPPSTARTICG